MPRFIRYKGFRFPKTDTVNAPEKRLGLPCFKEEQCYVKYCKLRSEEDIECPDDFCNQPTCGYCTKAKCPKVECERRINLGNVSVLLCIRAKCENLVVSMAPYCQLYFDELKRKRKKPPPFSFPQGVRTPSGDVRGFYGQKRIDGSGRFA